MWGGISFQKAMRQRKVLGEKASFGQFGLISAEKEGEKHKSPDEKNSENTKVE